MIKIMDNNFNYFKNNNIKIVNHAQLKENINNNKKEDIINVKKIDNKEKVLSKRNTIENFNI